MIQSITMTIRPISMVVSVVMAQAVETETTTIAVDREAVPVAKEVMSRIHFAHVQSRVLFFDNYLSENSWEI